MVAKKKTTTKRARKAKTEAQLPKGFTAISGGYNANWPGDDTKVGDAIQGVVTGYREVPRPKNKGGDTMVATVELKDGTSVDIWKGAVLKPMFDDDYEGVEVWIRYDGLGKKKRGQNQARLYTFAYEEE